MKMIDRNAGFVSAIKLEFIRNKEDLVKRTGGANHV